MQLRKDEEPIYLMVILTEKNPNWLELFCQLARIIVYNIYYTKEQENNNNYQNAGNYD